MLAIGLALATAAGVLGAAPRPAGAIGFHTGASEVSPQTWVDDGGRQYVVTTGYEQRYLLVARDTPSGVPDPLWGTFDGKPGLRSIAVAPPADGLERGTVVSFADGLITTVWSLPGCGDSCTRWFVRTAPDGTPVGDPVERADVGRPVEALDDGSFITTAPGYAVRWIGPDGAIRTTATIGQTQYRSITIDGSGRLLVVNALGRVTRWPTGGPSDLTLETGCDTGFWAAIGADEDDDGFAVACGATTAAGLTVTRYDVDGEVEWSTTGAPTASASINEPRHLAIDDGDQVWVAGTGSFTPPDSAMTIGMSGIASFAEGAPPVARSQRATQGQGWVDFERTGVSDLRPIGAGRVAYADLKDCCLMNGGGGPDSSVFGAVLPARPTAPTPACTPRDLQITDAGYRTVTVSFLPCPDESPGPAPTAYTVDVGGRTAAAPAPASPSTPVTLTVDGLYPYSLAQATARAGNDGGAGPASPTAVTVLPFPSVDAFVQRQYADLVGRPPSAQELATARATASAPGDVGAATVASGLLGTGRAAKAVEPTARLYRAYFLRDPDLAGLRFWVARREEGRTLTRMSDGFAASSEFARRYGSLTNRAFVETLYENVFGRAGDPTGIAFWTKRIDQRRLSRGGVVLQFSESDEGIRKASGRVEPIAAAFLMLGRLPTPLERSSWAALVRPSVAIPREVLGSEEYADRIG